MKITLLRRASGKPTQLESPATLAFLGVRSEEFVTARGFERPQHAGHERGRWRFSFQNGVLNFRDGPSVDWEDRDLPAKSIEGRKSPAACSRRSSGREVGKFEEVHLGSGNLYLS